jgi:hypothetical protein
MKLSKFVATTRQAAKPMYWDIEDELQRGGWKPHKQSEKFWKKHTSPGDHVSVWVKGFGGVRIEAVLHDHLYSISIMLSPTFAASKLIPDDLKKEHEDALQKQVDVTKQFKLSTVEQEAKNVAVLVKKLRKPRPKKTYDWMRYDGKQGVDALKAWIRMAEEIIIQDLKSAKLHGDSLEQETLDIGYIMSNILDNYGRDPGFRSRKTAYAQILAILRRLKKRNLVQELTPRDTGLRKTLWEWMGPK